MNLLTESGVNFRRAKLRDTNLSGAELSEADLAEADLRGADLREAVLRRTNLARADLGGACLGRTVFGLLRREPFACLGMYVVRRITASVQRHSNTDRHAVFMIDSRNRNICAR